MTGKGLGSWGAAVLLVATVACEKESAVRPSAVDGESGAVEATATDARTGITMIAPRAVSPADEQLIGYGEQPLSLVVLNGRAAARSSLSYTFEVATDEVFSSIVHSVSDVQEGSDGRTSGTIPTLSGDLRYYWRARAVLGTIEGPNSRTRRFDVGPEVTLQAPALAEPQHDATASDRPTLRVANVARSGPAGPLTYIFELSEQSTFATLVYSGTQPEGAGGFTSHTVSQPLEEKTYWWRARANDPANRVVGPSSNARSFRAQRGLDLSQVVWVKGPNLHTTFERTATISDAYQLPRPLDQLCIYHDRLGLWPPTAFFGDPNVTVEGNQWGFRFLNGVWYGGAAHWYRPGQACKAHNAGSWRDTYYRPNEEPLHSWVPQPGEVFGVAATTPARFWPDMRTYDEMTNVHLVVQP
jgi:hypothetical protein